MLNRSKGVHNERLLCKHPSRFAPPRSGLLEPHVGPKLWVQRNFLISQPPQLGQRRRSAINKDHWMGGKGVRSRLGRLGSLLASLVYLNGS